MMRRILLVITACGLLAACGSDSWFGGNDPKPLPGKRISVLDRTSALEPDPSATAPIVLPPPEKVPDWPQAGGFPPHAMFHLALREHIHKVWSANVGDGASKRRAFITAPVVWHGVVYAMDAKSQLSAFSLKDGDELWDRDLTPEDVDNGSFGGGLAVDGGVLYATTSYAQMVAMDLKAKGKELWRIQLPAPVRGAPTVRAGRVLVITVDNETHAYSAADGHELWHHEGMSEGASLVGGTSPAVDGNSVVVAYSSGEVYSLRIENGTPMWNDGVASMRRTDQVGTLTDIRGLPVVDSGRVYVAGNSDMTAAIDLRSGRRVWEREIGSQQTPWVAGDFLFMVSNAPDLICIQASTGQVRWVTPLQKWVDPEQKSDYLTWTGPVLASNRLVVVSSAGEAMAVSPYTGKVLGSVELSDGVTIAPIVADGTLLFVTTAGDLVAYR
ncbi:outer membrane protein assembly factor BamB precursor [mine drainage metagenome]|uniref:Outer membrane protein assembly factor BamB n=1 Tax=mine drainage metagenome TaxID=410659 RepID=A0A1J5RRT6_9ZZZZ